MQKKLVFFPTYNEAENVRPLILSILENLPDAEILVVDDHSPDGTGELLDELMKEFACLQVIHRARKMGIGSAHKLAMQFAIANDFDFLVTMDADFSHHPKYLSKMMALLEKADFVTGSRYVKGGSCDYGFYRTFISRTANIAAKLALGLKLKENTTVYRGFRVSMLNQINLDQIKSEGYSYAIESLYLIAKHTKKIDEFPIHFENRRAGKSKISKVEIYKAIYTILRLFWERVIPDMIKKKASENEYKLEMVACQNCSGTFHTELLAERKNSVRQQKNLSYSCSSQSDRVHGKILRCLKCGLVFMKPKLSAEGLIHEYSETEDPTYLNNIKAREETFQYNLSRVKHYFQPDKRLLDVGSYCGAFLKIAGKAGLDVEGVEPSSWAVKASSQLTDAPVIHGTLTDIPLNHDKFDLITLWDVLEHFSDPTSELKKINSLLKPDGHFLFSTLMVDNWFPKITGKYWPWYMDMHLYYFTMPTVSAILAQSGFEIVEVKNYCHIITAGYLLSKLGTLGVPFANSLSNRMSQTALGKKTIPFRFGDIKLFVCRKAESHVNAAEKSIASNFAVS